MEGFKVQNKLLNPLIGFGHLMAWRGMGGWVEDCRKKTTFILFGDKNPSGI